MSLAPSIAIRDSASTPLSVELVGVFKILADQHHQVAELLDEVRSNPALRATHWPLIRTELISHERGEVREVMPVLRANPQTRVLADPHDADAVELETMIVQLDALPFESEAWGELFARLADTVLAHAMQEEAAVFPVAQRALGEARALQIEAPFVKAKLQIAAAI